MQFCHKLCNSNQLETGVGNSWGGFRNRNLMVDSSTTGIQIDICEQRIAEYPIHYIRDSAICIFQYSVWICWHSGADSFVNNKPEQYGKSDDNLCTDSGEDCGTLLSFVES